MGTLVGPNGGPAISGEQDAMSILNYTNIRYAGGAVPQASSNFFSGITLFNARPTITNVIISDTGGSGGTEAAIGADMDSFREDDTARGPLIRQITLTDNSLNGIWLMSESNGFIEPTNAMPYPHQPVDPGGIAELHLLRAAAVRRARPTDRRPGARAQHRRRDRVVSPTGSTSSPACMMSSTRAPASTCSNPGSSLNVGSRSYINGYDQNNDYSPLSPGFVEESASDPTVLFTSIYDDTATTTLVPTPINVTNETTEPTPGPGDVGQRRHPERRHRRDQRGHVPVRRRRGQHARLHHPSQSVLAFITEDLHGLFPLPVDRDAVPGLDTSTSPTTTSSTTSTPRCRSSPTASWRATRSRRWQSGHPVLPRQRDGRQRHRRPAWSSTNRVVLLHRRLRTVPRAGGPIDPVATGYSNQTVNAVWDATDMTYVLQGNDRPGGLRTTSSDVNGQLRRFPSPPPARPRTEPMPSPAVSLTIQAALPGTLLADGETIPSPGQSVIVKLYNDEHAQRRRHRQPGDELRLDGRRGVRERAARASSSASTTASIPPASPTRRSGCVFRAPHPGHPGNQTTGQQRVPVIITSLRDDTVGTTVRGVVMDDIWNSAPVQEYQAAANGTTLNLTTPERRRRRLYLHRRQLADRVRPDRPASTAASSRTPTSAT